MEIRFRIRHIMMQGLPLSLPDKSSVCRMLLEIDDVS